jgi:hypothetical protein
MNPICRTCTGDKQSSQALACRAPQDSPFDFYGNTLFGTPVGHDNNNFTLLDNHNAEDAMEVSLDDLDEEQKKLVEAHKDAFTKLCFD